MLDALSMKAMKPSTVGINGFSPLDFVRFFSTVNTTMNEQIASATGKKREKLLQKLSAYSKSPARWYF
jgi:hypothetical protein